MCTVAIAFRARRRRPRPAHRREWSTQRTRSATPWCVTHASRSSSSMYSLSFSVFVFLAVFTRSCFCLTFVRTDAVRCVRVRVQKYIRVIVVCMSENADTLSVQRGNRSQRTHECAVHFHSDSDVSHLHQRAHYLGDAARQVTNSSQLAGVLC